MVARSLQLASELPIWGPQEQQFFFFVFFLHSVLEVVCLSILCQKREPSFVLFGLIWIYVKI